jgi:hypothetical protein
MILPGYLRGDSCADTRPAKSSIAMQLVVNFFTTKNSVD